MTKVIGQTFGVLPLGGYETNFSKLSYQGLIQNDGGDNVPDGQYSLTFKIYDYESGSTDIWNETQTINISGGIISVILGEINPIDLPFTTSYWLGITIGDGEELTPRTPLVGNIYRTGFGK